MTVAICSLGCKVNIYESEYVESLLKNHGYEIVPFDSVSDIYIINTCSVTNESDKKSRKMIHQAKRRNEHALIIVMGCYSQVKSSEIEADIIIGNKDKSKILDYIKQYHYEKKTIKKIYNLREPQEFEQMCIDKFDNHTRAFVKIQDGCNAFCSYCIIPYTRGTIRSKKKEDVISEVTSLVQNGYKEIVLTGIHTGKYGIDLGNTNLEDLLKSLVEIKGIYRIRLSSIEINEITDGILDLIKDNQVMSSHMHIPIQSGSDKILKSMNRKYDLEYFIKRVNEIKNIREDMSITTDLIVGFPGETDVDFKETLKTIKKIGFTKIHTFPYSKRDKTPASVMKNQVDGNIKKQRVKQVIELSNNLEYEFYKKFINKVLEGVIEVKKDGTTMLHTSNFIPIELEEKERNQEIVSVKITKVYENRKVYGEVVKK